MIEQHFYRQPWTRERTEFIHQWWPHYGTYWVAEQLGLTRRQVKAKADTSGLKLLHKAERRCMGCEEGRQYTRSAGFYCRECFMQRRQAQRRTAISDNPLRARILEVVRTVIYRNALKGHDCDITADFLHELWNKQQGKCFYTDRPMIASDQVGRGRAADAMSIDRINSSLPYSRANVVLCTWWANIAKAELTSDDFLDRCRSVVTHLGRTPREA